MATIQADPKKFHTEDGGWSFLSNESDGSGGGESSSEEVNYSSLLTFLKVIRELVILLQEKVKMKQQ